MTAPKPCIDCTAAGRPATRPATFPGPRCATDWRIERNRRRAVKQERNRRDRYGITPEDYERLRAHQGSRCAICRRATGATKRLAVDHDHKCCPGPTSCGRCIRGLLCGPCNSMMAHARDEPQMFYRAIDYLREWPSMSAGI